MQMDSRSSHPRERSFLDKSASGGERAKPYALFTPLNGNIQHTLSPKKSKHNRNLLFYNAIRSAKSIQIQPINPNLIKIG